MEERNIISSLASKLYFYVTLIEDEYMKYITDENKEKLNNIKQNPSNSIRLNQSNSISLFVRNDKIYFPLQAYDVISQMSKLPEFLNDPHHKSCEIDHYVINDKTFKDYINHAIIKGITPLEYFEENLLHEVMHLCGGGGSSSLEEGLTELKTREIAQKYGLLTSGCGYPKEVKVVLLLEKIIGKEHLDTITFMGDNLSQVDFYLKNNCSDEIRDFYFDIRAIMKQESKSYKEQIMNITDPQEKAKAYDKINYQKANEKIAQMMEVKVK